MIRPVHFMVPWLISKQNFLLLQNQHKHMNFSLHSNLYAGGHSQMHLTCYHSIPSRHYSITITLRMLSHTLTHRHVYCVNTHTIASSNSNVMGK